VRGASCPRHIGYRHLWLPHPWRTDPPRRPCEHPVKARRPFPPARRREVAAPRPDPVLALPNPPRRPWIWRQPSETAQRMANLRRRKSVHAAQRRLCVKQQCQPQEHVVPLVRANARRRYTQPACPMTARGGKQSVRLAGECYGVQLLLTNRPGRCAATPDQSSGAVGGCQRTSNLTV
jgi:hypothetical protein